jgi:coenzyme F420-reducing hydrogenase alpha subunit
VTRRQRTIRVEALTRVEGEGGLYVRLRGNRVSEVRLDIYEPPRLFESLLRGRHFSEAPDITARICGICPIAYQMSSVHAIEAALDCHPGPEIRRLRRLLYCGEWIESHALHIHLLHAPDFLGYESGLAMAADYPEEVKRGLRLKKHGNELIELFGGRAIHPINVTVGGFFRLPDRDRASRLIPDFEWGLDAAMAMTRWVAALDFPEFDQQYEMVALTHEDEYPMNEGRLRSSTGMDIDPAQFETRFVERQVPHSTAWHCLRRDGDTSYLVGPLSRVALNFDRLAEPARRLADELTIDWSRATPYQGIVARGLEVVHAYAEALAILRTYRQPRVHRVEAVARSSAGAAATEAPRGTLYHRYEIGEGGRIERATIIPPTSQNQAQIENDLRRLVSRIATLADAEIERRCEQLVRSYDPCISCSTHFLKLTLQRDDSSPHFD